MDNTSGQHEADRARCNYQLGKFHCPKKPLDCQQKNRIIIDRAPYQTGLGSCPYPEPLKPIWSGPGQGWLEKYGAWLGEDRAWYDKCWKWSKEKEEEIRKHPEKYNTDPRCNGSSKPSS
jgi:hypothetical protein